jgi:hypothetical protein
LEDAEALAGVKILKHVHDEIVEKFAYLPGNEKGLGRIILGLRLYCAW